MLVEFAIDDDLAPAIIRVDLAMLLLAVSVIAVVLLHVVPVSHSPVSFDVVPVPLLAAGHAAISSACLMAKKKDLKIIF